MDCLKKQENWLFLLLFIVCTIPIQKVWAEAEKKTEVSNKDEYDFSWLDPDKNIYVVQNRKYTKANHLEVSVSGGSGLSETYRTVHYLNPRAIYYLNEQWGVSGLGMFLSSQENDTWLQLQKESSAIPAVRETESIMGVSVVWLPFYAKINVFNKIFYFDWYFELGAGSVKSKIDLNTKAGNPPVIQEATDTGFFFGTGQKYFISRSVAARLEFLMLRYTPNSISKGVILSTTDQIYNYYMGLGLSYTF